MLVQLEHIMWDYFRQSLRLLIRHAHLGRRIATHASERIASGFRSVGPTPHPQKASPLGVYTLNHINHACLPTTHNIELFPTV